MSSFEKNLLDRLKLILFSGFLFIFFSFCLLFFLFSGIDEKKSQIFLNPLAEQVKISFENNPSKENFKDIALKHQVELKFITEKRTWTAGKKKGETSPGFKTLLPFFDQWTQKIKKESVEFRFELRKGTLFVRVFPGSFENKKKIKKVFFIFLLVCFIVFYFLLKGFVTPLSEISNTISKINNGEFHKRLSRKKAGPVAGEFNSLISKIGKAFQVREGLLNGLGHELKTPLTKMKLELALQPESEFSKSMAEEINEIDSLISRMLESARSRTGINQLKREKTDIGKLISNLVKKRESRQIRVFFPSFPVLLNIDEEMFKSVIRNLLDNAEKYSPDKKSEILVGIVVKKKETYIQVRDFGIGIRKKDLPFILEPFYRADSSRCRSTGGFGLGLSICQTIVKAHGGEISIESEVEKGTFVSVSIPHDL